MNRSYLHKEDDLEGTGWGGGMGKDPEAAGVASMTERSNVGQGSAQRLKSTPGSLSRKGFLVGH